MRDKETIMQLLEKQLEKHEGFVPHAYEDSEGYLTIGIGTLIDERRGGGITLDEARYLMRNRLLRFKNEMDDVIPWWRRLSVIRRVALLNMAFNLGVPGLLGFKNMIAALERGDFKRAKREALNSRWADQVGKRAQEIAYMIENDELP